MNFHIFLPGLFIVHDLEVLPQSLQIKTMFNSGMELVHEPCFKRACAPHDHYTLSYQAFLSLFYWIVLKEVFLVFCNPTTNPCRMQLNTFSTRGFVIYTSTVFSYHCFQENNIFYINSLSLNVHICVYRHVYYLRSLVWKGDVKSMFRDNKNIQFYRNVFRMKLNVSTYCIFFHTVRHKEIHH